MIKKKFTQAKSALMKSALLTQPEESLVGRSVNKMVSKLMSKVLPSNDHPTGFREYTNSPNFQEEILGEAVTAAMNAIRVEENNPDRSFDHRELFAIGEKVKRDHWASLPASEKSEWAAKAKDLDSKLEELTLFVTSHVLNHL